MIAAFMSAIAISQTLGGPISGWIMAKMSGIGTLRGWQWLFLIEGIPSVIIGIIALVFLDDGPQTAHWLSAEERELLTARLAEEEAYKKREGSKAHRLIDAFKNSKVWLLCLAYFGLVNGVYGATFWLPQIIKDRITADLWLIGLISMIPWGFGAVAMIWWGRHSDLSEERHWHVTAALGVAALFFVVSGIQDLPAHLAIGALTIAIAGITSSLSTFWAIPTAMLSGTAAAGGIAWINSVGNLGGYVSPHLIGYIRDQTGNNMFPALVALAVACLFSGLIILVIRGRP
jgi:nitrate/nitrite transporter NarK